MNKENMSINNSELTDLEKEVDSLDDLKEWSNKINKMKELKEQIIIQKVKINNLIEMINSGEVKKSKKRKDTRSIDELTREYDNTTEIFEKVKLFNLIQSMIKESELELFDE